MGDNQTAVLTPWDVQSNRIVSEKGKAATLYGGAGQGTHNGAVMQSIGLDLYNGNTTGDIAATITASSGKSASQSGPSVMQKCYGISSYESNAMKSQNPSSGIYEADKARTLDTSGGNPACNQGGIAIAEIKPIGIATQSYYDMQISDKGATLRAAGGTYGGAVRPMSCKLASGKNVTGTIMANCDTKQFLGNQEAFSGDYFIIEDNKKMQYTVDFGRTADRIQMEATKSTTLSAQGGGMGAKTGLYCLPRGGDDMEYIVRRLTPLECERLQGLPDRFTDIEFKGKPAPDSKRYKAIGNGMAHPCASFVLAQIVKAERG